MRVQRDRSDSYVDTGFTSQDAQSDFNRARRRAALATHRLPIARAGRRRQHPAAVRGGRRRARPNRRAPDRAEDDPARLNRRLGRPCRGVRPRLPAAQPRRIRTRWQRINVAQRRGEGMPPIEVLRVGGLHFVVDGHHRVSVARHLGHDVIEAYVTEITTRVSPEQGLKLADLPAKSHERLFVERVPLTVEERSRISFSDPDRGLRRARRGGRGLGLPADAGARTSCSTAARSPRPGSRTSSNRSSRSLREADLIGGAPRPTPTSASSASATCSSARTSGTKT